MTKKQKNSKAGKKHTKNIMIALPNFEDHNKLIPLRRKYMKKAIRTDISFLFPTSSFPE